MKILVLSYEPWDNANSFGNSHSAIWEGMKDVEIANIYCRYGDPHNNVATRYFQITDKAILKRLLKGTPSGREVFLPVERQIQAAETLSGGQWKIINWLRAHQFRLAYWARDAIWMTGGWKSPELEQFVRDFDPDIVWVPIYYSAYMNVIGLYLADLTGKPMVGYISDDNYTMHQFNWSPFWWAERLVKRPYIKKAIERSEVLYVITHKQKEEYDKLFHKDCKLLWKGADFQRPMPPIHQPNQPLKMVFMGNLGQGRWKTMIEVTELLEELNREKLGIELAIYTGTPLTERIKAKLNRGGARLMPFLPAEQVDTTFQQADILLHVEPTNLQERLQYRLSFSTKLVDYFRNAGCILAYGGMTGSMDYLIREDAGLVATSRQQLKTQLQRLMKDPALCNAYRQKSWECGKRNHEIRELQADLAETLRQTAQK